MLIKDRPFLGSHAGVMMMKAFLSASSCMGFHHVPALRGGEAGFGRSSDTSTAHGTRTRGSRRCAPWHVKTACRPGVFAETTQGQFV